MDKEFVQKQVELVRKDLATLLLYCQEDIDNMYQDPDVEKEEFSDYTMALTLLGMGANTLAEAFDTLEVCMEKDYVEG